jgi:hypothetical protein
MLLAFYNNRPYTAASSGGIEVGGQIQPSFTIVASGGIEVGGQSKQKLIESHIGWKCRREAKYLKSHYVEAGSNIKRRDYTGRPKSKALVAAITLCNQNIDKLFE